MMNGSSSSANGLAMLSSYYLLYHPNRRSVATGKHEISKLSGEAKTTTTADDWCEKRVKNGNDNDSSSKKLNGFWEEFEWTTEEKEQAQTLLHQNLAKCDIKQNLPPGRRDEYNHVISKYEEEAQENWNKFYSSHQTKFFNDRHYLHKAFPEEFGIVYNNCVPEDDLNISKDDGVLDDQSDFTIVEIGSGVGNTVLPLLELGSHITITLSKHDLTATRKEQMERAQKRRLVVWGLDFSETAIELLKKDERFIKASSSTPPRAKAGVWDITKTHPKDIIDSPSSSLQSISDISLLLFCLSALSPEKMIEAAKNVSATLRPGGVLVLRDYGRYDEAQLKLGTSRAKRLGENFYVKHDGTRCYYFELKDLEALFGKDGAGLEIVELKYIQRLYTNRSKDHSRRRVWVQARFRKPTTSST